ncbi:MAG: hypothetical protein J6B08_01300 [Ruminiclostridium sp.]|nr:hypothetical protein [Ruminiclostridium sp.]
MKACSWCLWIGSKKVFNIRQLRECFDTDVLIGYYKSGVLEKWLIEAEEKAVLEKVQGIDRGGDIASQLEFVFGVRPDPKPEPIKEEIVYPEVVESVRLALLAVSGEYKGVFLNGSSSFNGSFSPSSFRSIHEWEFENGSFNKGSFRKGSFNAFSGSFRSGSFSGSSFRLVKTSFKSGSFSSGSFRFSSGGSFRYFIGEAEITAEEYKRTRINLSSCPLNEHGYGIHRI